MRLDYSPFMQVLPIKRPNSCGIRARYCDALCAARMTQFLYRLSCSFRLGVSAVERNCARARRRSWSGDSRMLCEQQWHVWAVSVGGFRSTGPALCAARASDHVGDFCRSCFLNRWLFADFVHGLEHSDGRDEILCDSSRTLGLHNPAHNIGQLAYRQSGRLR